MSISGVVPRSLAVGLTADVTISGYATKWTDQSVVSFGAGVTVRAVKAASSSAMLATIDVSPTAAPGPRDVTVSEGTTTTTFKGFEVLPYASLSIAGTPIQGGLVRAHLVVNDPMFVFPTNTSFNAGSGVGLVRVEKQRSRSADVLLGVNLDAAPGARTVSVGGNLTFPDAFSVAANTPTDLPMLPLTVPFSAGSQSVVYNLTGVTQGTILEASEGGLLGLLAPDAGWTATSMVGSSLLLQNPAGTLTLFDGAGDGGMSTISGSPIPEVADTEPNDTELTAQTLTALPVMITGAIVSASVDDEDWFKLAVPASAVGKRVRIIATSSGFSYDIYVDVRQGGVRLGGRWNLFSSSGATKTALSSVIPAAGDLFFQIAPWSADCEYAVTFLFE